MVKVKITMLIKIIEANVFLIIFSFLFLHMLSSFTFVFWYVVFLTESLFQSGLELRAILGLLGFLACVITPAALNLKLRRAVGQGYQIFCEPLNFGSC